MGLAFEESKLKEGVELAFHNSLFDTKEWRSSINNLDFEILEG